MLVIYRLMTTPQVLRSGAWNTTVPVPPDESLGNSRFGPLAISLVKSLLTLDTGQTLIRMRHCRFGDSNNFQSCCTSLNPSWIARCLLGIALAMGWLQRKDSPITGMSAGFHIHLPCSHSYCTVCIYIYIYITYTFFQVWWEKESLTFSFCQFTNLSAKPRWRCCWDLGQLPWISKMPVGSMPRWVRLLKRGFLPT